MNVVAAIVIFTLSGCHNGFCHNEVFLIFGALTGLPVIGAWLKIKLDILHKKLGHNVPVCEEKCKEHR